MVQKKRKVSQSLVHHHVVSLLYTIGPPFEILAPSDRQVVHSYAHQHQKMGQDKIFCKLLPAGPGPKKNLFCCTLKCKQNEERERVEAETGNIKSNDAASTDDAKGDSLVSASDAADGNAADGNAIHVGQQFSKV